MKRETKTESIKIRLSESDLGVIDVMCERYRKNRSELIRWALFEKKMEFHIGREEVDHILEELVVSLSRIGNNMNQIARYFNSGGTTSNDMEAALQSQLSLIEGATKIIEERLSR